MREEWLLSQWLLSYLVKSRGSNPPTPVLKSCTPPTERRGTIECRLKKQNIVSQGQRKKLTLRSSTSQSHIKIYNYKICTKESAHFFVGTNCFQLFPKQSRLLTTLRKKPFKNIVGKGENAGNQHFLLFPACFLPFPNQFSIFQSHIFCRLQMLSIWTSLKFCRMVMD